MEKKSLKTDLFLYFDFEDTCLVQFECEEVVGMSIFMEQTSWRVARPNLQVLVHISDLHCSVFLKRFIVQAWKQITESFC